MTDEISLSVDKAGMVLGLRVHDGYLYKLAFLDSSNLHLGIRRSSGGLIAVDLIGLGELTVAGLWNGAIVAELFQWKVNAVPDEAHWNVLLSGKVSRVTPNAMRAAVLDIVHGRPTSFLVQVNFSYGGSIAAVCDRLAAHEIQADPAPEGE